MMGLEIDYPRLRGEMRGSYDRCAAAIGVSTSTLTRKVNGHVGLRLRELNEIAKALGKDTMHFLVEREM